MKPLAYTLLTDENIHPEVAAELRRQGKDVAPGHIQATYTLQSLRAIEATVGEVEAGFVIVAEHRTGQVRVRLRASPAASV